MSINKEPQNLFSSTHVLSILGFCYFTVVSPAVDKFAEGRLNREDTIKTLNGLVYAALAASLKMFDKEVYTPKLIPGRSKEKAINNINEELLEPTTNIIQQVVKDAVQDVVAQNIDNVNTKVDKAINNFTTDTINSLIPDNNTVSNTITKAVMPNIVNTVTDSITSNLSNDINNNINNTMDQALNNINDLFKTSKALIPKDDIHKDNSYLLDNEKQTNIILTNRQDTFYKFEPVDSSILSDEKRIKVKTNKSINIDTYDINNPTNNHVKFTINNTTLYAFIPHITIKDNDKEVELIKPIQVVNNNVNYLRPTIDQCEKVFDTVMKYSLYNDFIKCINTFNINTPLDVAMFMSQVAHESAGLRYTKEIASGVDYNDWPELGNVHPGDGPKYKGAGFLQMTGRYNYQAFANHVNDPRVMEGVDYVAATYPFSSAGFWWKNNDMSNFINNEGATIQEVSTRVNGANPANGLADRIYYYNKAKKEFGIA